MYRKPYAISTPQSTITLSANCFETLIRIDFRVSMTSDLSYSIRSTTLILVPMDILKFFRYCR